MSLILASSSPRRKELLGILGKPFCIRVADIDETMDKTDDPAHQVGLVSCRKAMAVEREAEDVVIAADTIVVCDGQILGKPKSPADASRMLHLLSGRAHQVMTGLTVAQGDKVRTVTEISDVFFRELSDAEIAAYIATGEPMDKAGAYGIQGKASIFVTGIEGDYFSVMGLPVSRLCQVLRTFGIPVLDV